MANEIYLLSINGQTERSAVENVMAFEGGNLTADDTFDNGNFLLSAWVTNIQSLWLACLPDDYWLVNITARRATPKPSAVTKRQYQTTTSVGTFTSGMTTDQLCPSVFLVPTMGTKSGGKVFMPCTPNTAVLNNQYSGPYITAIDNLFNALIANFGTSGKTWQLAVYSRKLHTYSTVVGYTLSGRFGFQKKRRIPV